MSQKTFFFILLLALAGLNLGTVRKTEDPIRDTQTSPIGYQQKMEEEKDGVKGPLMYHVKYNPKDAFFIEPPFEKEKEASGTEMAKEEPSAVSDWWEEKPAQEAVPPEQETATPETAALETVQALPENAVDQPGSGSREDPAAKADDYWW